MSLYKEELTDVYAVEKDSLILRDLLATDRTILANKRTFLAYVRTALSLIVAGSSFIKFSGLLLIEIVGYILLPLGIVIGIVGICNYIKNHKSLRKIKSASNYQLY